MQILHWKPAILWQRLQLSPQEKSCLLETASLTAKFKQDCPNLIVEVLSEQWQVPLNYEQEQLGLNYNQRAWVRCVVLKCGQKPLLYARTIIPNLSSRNPWFALKKLGNNPLGEILFNLKSIERSPFKLSKQQYAWPYLEMEKQTSARYSLFKQQTFPLLLTEVFL